MLLGIIEITQLIIMTERNKTKLIPRDKHGFVYTLKSGGQIIIVPKLYDINDEIRHKYKADLRSGTRKTSRGNKRSLNGGKGYDARDRNNRFKTIGPKGHPTLRVNTPIDKESDT